MQKIPSHIAIVMDGNGRWAQRRGHARVFGHARGTSRVKPVVREANRLGIKALTLYAFSTENWARPEGERSALWKLLVRYLLKERAELKRENVRLHVIGEVERLPESALKVLNESIEYLSGCTGLELTFAISYGSRKEIARAARLFAEDCAAGKRKPDEMTEELLQSYLWTSYLGDLAHVDLVIRTSGEKRVSNYLLWQAAYAEYLFLDMAWPDFGPDQLRQAVEDYASRERRFGGVGAPAKAVNKSAAAASSTSSDNGKVTSS